MTPHTYPDSEASSVSRLEAHLNGFLIMLNHLRGQPIKYVRRFFGFFDPPSPLVRILVKSAVLKSRNLAYYVRFWVPSPLRAYVLNGCPLMTGACIIL